MTWLTRPERLQQDADVLERLLLRAHRYLDTHPEKYPPRPLVKSVHP
jgi:hypothetical protein